MHFHDNRVEICDTVPNGMEVRGNTRTHVGLVFTHSYDYYRGILRGIRRYTEARPDWLLTMLVPEQQSRSLRGRGRPDGLITALDTEQMVRSLSAWRRPVVDVSAVLPILRFPRVRVDNARVGQLAAAHFLERGLRQFAFVGPPHYLFAHERQAAFCQAVREAGCSVTSYENSVRMEYDPSGRRWDLEPGVERWLRTLPKPVGVFAPSDLWGVQLMAACRRAGLRVPEDVPLLGVGDDALFCELARPTLSSVKLPTEQIGYEAAALLERLLAGGKPPAGETLLPPPGVATRRSTDILAVDDEYVAAAVRFIRDHAHVPFGVPDVLKHVPVGRRTLERRFRLALGWGLGEEIRRTHFERACRLLVETDLPLNAVAHQAGYVDYRHVALAFRKTLGTTPTTYRRRFRRPAPEAPS